MAGEVISARRHAAASLINKINALAYTELPDKLKELADLRRTHAE